ncbi:MAG: translation initiation factor eIF-6, partial [Candidatus Methanomethylophilaceae archaeon]|nr:translation initiation factor eIF-6 [Candidatus Methanomethylophilaceae archaeon]
MMRLSRYGGSPNVGVFAATNESLTFVASDASPEFIKTIEETLGTEAVPVTVSGSMVIGSLIAMNSRGAIVPNFTDDSEFEKISSYIPCIRLDQTLNAAGNNILVNDTGAVVNP